MTESERLIDSVAEEVHNAWRVWIKELTQKSHSLERKIRNKWLLKDKPYSELTEEQKKTVRLIAHSIMLRIAAHNTKFDFNQPI